ncbi:D-alanyl-lipoteichoic acid biosynthesis protein DltB [Anaerovorax odorimutans]|uniref:Teichoic acid D-alanyltransferase n=1 Tax=Anaerovorax odorimutans TaxID=109327 RepID=A0ABT1RQ64_9FIRM|nr:D-alanyl-lipoteichoic acid biosynthesis protein DltB [Anaerovorax odorimutans]MCQ4637340.1 D-alanyl-lipoteichoic acid biosynthesis protein DltB [Anaerovorax odorimutans]
MSFFGSIQFFLLMILLFIPAAVLGLRGKSLRGYRTAASVLMIGLVMWPNKEQLLYLIAFYVLEFVLVKAYLKLRLAQADHRSAAIYRIFLFISILPLILCKISEVSGGFALGLFQFLGISYLTFRVAQMIIEIYDGIIKEVRWLDFTDFLLLFTTFSSGPIDRSRRYIKDGETRYTRDAYLELLGDGLLKILIGVIYKFILATLVHKGVAFFEDPQSFLEFAGYSYCYGIYMFFDFAGYSAMAIGASYILGIKVPENFNKPFISIDMKDFWNRWHMTLSFWFRDFIFSRFMMLAIKGKWFASRLTGASVGFIINMFVMGAWHGLAVNYILYGLYHGVLLALTEIYQKKSGFYKKNKKKTWYKTISWFVTLNMVMFGFLLFSGELI